MHDDPPRTPTTTRGSSTATLIPVHDQSTTATNKNYRRSVNTHIIIAAHARRVATVEGRWPGNHNDVIAARHTVTHLLTGDHLILGDGGYRGLTAATPAPGRSRRNI